MVTKGMTPEQEAKEAARQLAQNAISLVLDLLLSKGLYSSISIEGDIGEQAQARLRDGYIGAFDCYCVKCKQVTPFIITKRSMGNFGGGSRNNTSTIARPDVFSVSSICQRDLTSYV